MDSSYSNRFAFINRIKHKNAVILSLLVFIGVIASLSISGNAYADTVCYRVKFTQNGNHYHSNSVCREDSGTIKVVNNGNDVFNLFEERNYTYSPDYRDQPSICTHEQMIDKNSKKAVCRLKEGFELNGQTLIDMLKEQCNGVSCEWGNSLSNTNMRLQIGGAETVTEDEARAVQTIAEVSDANEDADPATETNEAGSKDVCYKGSGPLGWLICPVITALTGLGNGMWGFIEENFMQIQAPELFGSGSGVEDAWRAIRDIANVLFIILFLVVIFSQITGLGIDNYGVKKIMPKLIIVAILVNLSYIICELAVDLSNIIGSGISSLLSGMATDISNEAGVSTEGAGAANSSLTLVLAAGSTVLYGWLAPIGPIAIGLGAISIVFTVVAAIATLYFILVIREAGVVLLIAIAPIAMVCYLLPNTEKLFRKWFDLFKALLVAYPLCGLLVGAGRLASGVLATMDSSAMKITAMIVQVVPFFLIPTLLKSSLSLMGNIGATISNWTNRAGKGASGAAGRALQESDFANKWANKLGMASPFKGRRAAAFEAEFKRTGDSRRIRRNSDRVLMQERLEAAQAEDEAKAYSENISRRVASMRRGGIQTEKGLVSYNASGVEQRLKELAKRENLDDNEREEVAALMNAASGMAGGTGAMSRIIRNDGTTTAFMRAAGMAYSRDTSIQNKLAGDAGASYFVEQFTPGAPGAARRPDEDETVPDNLTNFGTFKGKEKDDGNYDKQIKGRAASYQVGLSQSGGKDGALGEYLDTLSSEDFERIASDTRLLNSIDQENLNVFYERYKNHQQGGASSAQSSQTTPQTDDDDYLDTSSFD